MNFLKFKCYNEVKFDSAIIEKNPELDEYKYRTHLPFWDQKRPQ